MQQISFNLERYINPNKLAASEWQDRAAQISDYLKAGVKRSAVFKLVQKDRTKSEAVVRYMQERGIQNVYYFFKAMK